MESSSQNTLFITVDLKGHWLYLLAALHYLRLPDADLLSPSTHSQAGFDPWRQGEHMAFSQ
jgi:hypothetical protein